MEHEKWMRMALEEAEKCRDDVPVGAVLVLDGRAVSRAHNQRSGTSPGAILAHAEMLALSRGADALGVSRLTGAVLYVTLEPCPMCAGAMMLAGIDRCYFGAYDVRQGCCGSVYSLPQDPRFYHRVPCVGGILEEECARLLQRFFRSHREGSGDGVQ